MVHRLTRASNKLTNLLSNVCKIIDNKDIMLYINIISYNIIMFNLLISYFIHNLVHYVNNLQHNAFDYINNL